MSRQPALFEYLLNRKTETEKLGADWKYAVIKALNNNPHFGSLPIDNVLRQELSEYYRQGAFYARFTPRVEEPLTHGQ